MELKILTIENPDELNFVLGQAHFIKTVEDVHEALVGAVPGIKFGFAFCESSGPRLVRFTGTDESLVQLAVLNARELSAGHVFILFLGNAYPINILKTLRDVPEIVRFFCATANPVQVAGLAAMIECVLQLRGEAGRRQVKGAQKALAHGINGMCGQSHCVWILGK